VTAEGKGEAALRPGADFGMGGSGMERKTPAGRPAKYRSEYCRRLLDYFDRGIAEEFPTFSGFAASIGTTRETMGAWRAQHPAFADAYARAREMQDHLLIAGAMEGRFNVPFAKFFAQSNLGYSDKAEGAADSTVTVELAPDLKDYAE
jgi:hypothetical protein